VPRAGFGWPGRIVSRTTKMRNLLSCLGGSLLTLTDHALQLLEEFRLRLSRMRGLAKFKPSEAYFGTEVGDPTHPSYHERLERINENFVSWIDPGEVAPPPPSSVERDGDVLLFPSACPAGDARVDTVALKVYPAPEGAPPAGVLFHHWIYLDGWGPVDYLLKPLTQRYRVAAMIAPHHLMRRYEGFGPGEGFLNPNVLNVFAGLRQWQADHAACLALLSRDHGFDETVLLGSSLGGFGSLLSRMMRPVLPTVAVCVTNHLSRGVFEGVATSHLVERLWEAGFSYDSFWWATRSLHLADWAPHIGGHDLTWMYARNDRIEPRDSLDEPVRALRPERIVELPGGHATAALFRERIASEVALRLENVVARCPGSPSAAARSASA